MKIVARAAVLGALLVASAVGTAQAQQPYTNPDTPVLPSDSDDVPGGEVEGDATETPSGGGAEAEVTSSAAPASGAATAPTGSLPLTGGDVVGMTVVAVGALAAGGVLVRRSRSMQKVRAS